MNSGIVCISSCSFLLSVHIFTEDFLILVELSSMLICPDISESVIGVMFWHPCISPMNIALMTQTTIKRGFHTR